MYSLLAHASVRTLVTVRTLVNFDSQRRTFKRQFIVGSSPVTRRCHFHSYGASAIREFGLAQLHDREFLSLPWPEVRAS